MLDRVTDDEVLYRSVPHGRGWLRSSPGGDCQHTSAAFLDRDMKPSVDRAAIILSATACKVGSTDGVLRLTAGQVRDCGADVVPDALIDKPSHALVVPDMLDKSSFRKLREALKRISEWEIPPSGPCE